MKKYVSAILIDVLLFQFCGCYSLKEITLDELKSNEEEIQFVTKDSTEYHLKKEITSKEMVENPDIRYSDDWMIEPEFDIITIIHKRTDKGSDEINIFNILTDTTNVNFDEIRELSALRLDGIKVAIAIGVTVGLTAFTIVAIRNALTKGWTE